MNSLSPGTKIEDGWILELEGLRGLAAAWVLIGHTCMLTGFRVPGLANPALGVDLFIFISGYLMASHYERRKQVEPWREISTPLKFWLRRFFRIAPLYYLLLAIAFYFAPALGEFREELGKLVPGSSTDHIRYELPTLANVIAHVSFLFGILPQYSFTTPMPDWSIGLEMQYYAVFPLIMLAIARYGYMPILVGLTIACGLAIFIWQDFASSFPMPSLLILKFHLFAAGMLLCKAVTEKRVGWVICGLCVITVSAVIEPSRGIKLALMQQAIFIFIGILIWPYNRPSPIFRLLKNIFSSRPMVLMGTLSYSTYLIHLLILIPVAAVVMRNSISTSNTFSFSVTVFITLITSYSLAFLLYEAIERPGIQMGKRLIGRLNSR